MIPSFLVVKNLAEFVFTEDVKVDDEIATNHLNIIQHV